MKKYIAGCLLIFASAVLYAQEIYINRIWHFGSDEFYIYLNFKEGYDWNNLPELNEQLGDYTFEGDENSRRELPLEVSGRYFDLTRLQDLELYRGGSAESLGRLKFKGVDFFDDMISSSYIAVFENASFTGKEVNWQIDYYCMSSPTDGLKDKDFAVVDLSGSELLESLKEKFSFTDKQLMELESKRIGATTLSVLSYFGANYENYSYLIESDKNEHFSLKFIQDDYVMWSMLPTPLLINEKPVIIMEMTVPDTDNLWTQLAVFNGKEYELLIKDFVKF